MTITAKFPSTCTACAGRILKGQTIEWVKGQKTARHTSCADGGGVAIVGGAATTARAGRWSRYTRFAGGAEVFMNERGRCEDAPCCGCCS